MQILFFKFDLTLVNCQNNYEIAGTLNYFCQILRQDGESLSEFSDECSENSFEEERVALPLSTSLPASSIVSSSPAYLTLKPQSISESTNDLILKRLEQIIEIQEQHTVLLNNIYRNQETQNISVIKRPTVVPNLPVTTKEEYKEITGEDYPEQPQA